MEDILIEEQIEGDCYRVLLMDGKHIDTILRDPPIVVGDGRSTVRQLLRKTGGGEQGGARSQVLVAADRDLVNTLARQGLGLGSRPAAGAVARLKQVINENALQENSPAGLSARILSPRRARQPNWSAFAWRGSTLFAATRSAPLGAGGGAIIEVNTRPGLYPHHIEGRGTAVALKVLEHHFGGTREAAQPVCASGQSARRFNAS